MLASAREIPPGGEGKIQITFRTYLDVGPITKSIDVFSNAAKAGKSRLEISAKVLAGLVCQPRIIDFGKVDRTFGGTATAAITGTGLGKVQILDVLSESPFVNAALGADGRSLEVTLLPGHPVGRLNQHLRFLTDNAETRYVPALMVSARVEGDLSVSPQLVDFNNLDKGPQRREVVVRSKSKKPFKLTEVRVTEPHFETDVTAIDGGYKVVLVARSLFKNARLELKTDNPEQPRLKVLLFGRGGK